MSWTSLSAKVRSTAAAKKLADKLQAVSAATGINIRTLHTDGSQPVGRGIGPALEALDVISVLMGDASAPADLRQRALSLASAVLEFAGRTAGAATAEATQLLASGAAWQKFQAICAAQGGMRTPTSAEHRREFTASTAGVVRSIENRKLARIAKLAGAPRQPAAGLELHVALGTRVERGQPLFTLHAEAPGELAYAGEFANKLGAAFHMEPV